MVGMVKARAAASTDREAARRGGRKPAVGLTMFGVTTPCVQAVTAALEDDFECLVFHATGVGGQSMEKLVDSGARRGHRHHHDRGLRSPVRRRIAGHGRPVRRDRARADAVYRLVRRARHGQLRADGDRARALRGRTLHVHNPTVTLMRTTPEENARIGTLDRRTAQSDGWAGALPLPEGGVSALDAPGRPFSDPDADEELFRALETTVRQTGSRRLIRMPEHINDPRFSAAIVAEFRRLFGGRLVRRRAKG